jgi:hypothetical protein
MTREKGIGFIMRLKAAVLSYLQCWRISLVNQVGIFLNSSLDGVSIEKIIEGIPVKRISKKADPIKESIRGSIDTT